MDSPLPHVLLTLAAVILLGRLLGRLLAGAGQPPVIGDVVAGVLLGPSLLGRLAPGFSSWLLPADAVSHLELLAHLGIVLYMFVVGLDLRMDALRGRTRSVLAISHAGIVVPFAAGVALAAALFPRYAGSAVDLPGFAMFMGVAMSITAFPILARILADTGLSHTRLGAMALTSAAAGDVTAWCLLALAVGTAHASIDAALWTIVLAAAFVLVMLVVVRPLIRRLLARLDDAAAPQSGVAAAVAGALLAALATEAIGVHAAFGAFLAGAVVPVNSRLAATLRNLLEPPVSLLLLPAFFALVGLRTDLVVAAAPGHAGVAVVIIVLATVSKAGATYAAARMTGLGTREAAALGVLMNTRGLMEIVVLELGLSLGVISPTLFTLMVVMAMVTTLGTVPLLRLVAPALQSSSARSTVEGTTSS
ncbi:MAG: cation:proton antiporter [Acidimicrobiia bacterium]|nr:cation:proton antiporter [Acidimicrobiia bacterium]